MDILDSLAGNKVGIGADGALVIRSGLIRGRDNLPVDFPNGMAFASAFNFRRDNLKRWQRAKARIMAGTGRGRIACVGDSTTAGVGATDSTGRRAGAYPAMLAKQLVAKGIPAIQQDLQNGRITPSATYNPTLTSGSGWGWTSPSNGIGGAMWTNTTTTNSLDWLPTVEVDTFEIYTLQSSGYGTVSYQINSGAATQISENGTDDLIKTVATDTKGSNTLKIARVSGNAYFHGAIAYDSATPAVDVLNFGVGSATSTTLNGSSKPWSANNAMADYAPDVVIYSAGINDYSFANYSISKATYETNLRAMLTAWTAVADVILCIPPPSSSARSPLVLQLEYNNITRKVAAEYNLPLFDFVQAWASFVDSNAMGYMFDTVHPNSLGYATMGMMLGTVLATV
jgi:lysophospholipase L1-like esterase